MHGENLKLIYYPYSPTQSYKEQIEGSPTGLVTCCWRTAF